MHRSPGGAQLALPITRRTSQPVRAMPVKHRVVVTLVELLFAHGMTIDDLRRDRRYAKATGKEIIVLEPRFGRTTKLYVVEAPPWLSADDFGPIGAGIAQRMGWWD